GQHLQPQGRVLRIRRADQTYPELGNGQECATHCRRSKRSPVEPAALDKQIRRASTAGEPPDLWPEAALHDRQVQVAHTLPLDDGGTDVVVADEQAAPLDPHSKLEQGLEHEALLLEDVDENQLRHFGKCPRAEAPFLVSVQARST